MGDLVPMVVLGAHAGDRQNVLAVTVSMRLLSSS